MQRYTELFQNRLLQKLYVHYLPDSSVLAPLDLLLARIEDVDARENHAALQLFRPVSATVMAL